MLLLRKIIGASGVRISPFSLYISIVAAHASSRVSSGRELVGIPFIHPCPERPRCPGRTNPPVARTTSRPLYRGRGRGGGVPFRPMVIVRFTPIGLSYPNNTVRNPHRPAWARVKLSAISTHSNLAEISPVVANDPVDLDVGDFIPLGS